MFEKELMNLDKDKKRELLKILENVREYFIKKNVLKEHLIGIFFMNNKLENCLEIHDYLLSIIKKDNIYVYDKSSVNEIMNYLNSLETYLLKWYNYTL